MLRAQQRTQGFHQLRYIRLYGTLKSPKAWGWHGPALTALRTVVGWWAAPAVASPVGYYLLWHTAFTGRDQALLYQRWCVVPVPMTVLPVVVFLSAG